MSPLTSQDVSDYLQVTLEEPGKTDIMKALQTYLPGAVQLYALGILERGGLKPQDFAWAAQYGPELDKAPLFADNKLITADAQFGIIAKGIAILAHFPGGVRLFKMHFEVNPAYKQQRNGNQSA